MRKFLSFFFLPVLVVSSLLLTSWIAAAQVDRSDLTGTVTDSAGKLLPGAEVTAVMPSTGLKRETVSSKDGTYSLPNLPVGTYTVTFQHAGFAPAELDNVMQTVDNTQTLNAYLRVSGGVEHVQVSAAAGVVDRTDAELT